MPLTPPPGPNRSLADLCKLVLLLRSASEAPDAGSADYLASRQAAALESVGLPPDTALSLGAPPSAAPATPPAAIDSVTGAAVGGALGGVALLLLVAGTQARAQEPLRNAIS